MVMIRASVAQCCSVGYDVDKTLEKMERMVKIAVDRDNSQFVVFPEAL
jgi:predicted amidohydrolase